jgi:hypothetical protein
VKHLAALADLVERGEQLAGRAAAEAKRLRKLPKQRNERVQGVVDSVISSLETVAAERALMAKWKKGLSKKADSISGKQADMTCTNLAVGKLLRKASEGWGVTIELSPAARKFKATLDVDVEGSPTLKQFLDWLAADQGLTYGHAEGKMVFVPNCSLKLAAAIRAKKKSGADGKPRK